MELLEYLLGFGGLAILLIALLSTGYYLAKLRGGWTVLATMPPACLALAIRDIDGFLFVAPLLSVLLGPVVLGFAIGWRKKHFSGRISIRSHRSRRLSA